MDLQQVNNFLSGFGGRAVLLAGAEFFNSGSDFAGCFFFVQK
jgi:hypothetical protein